MDRQNALVALIVIATGLLASGALVARAISGWMRGRTLRARRARASRGEREAEQILARTGWVVDARQVARTLRFEVDGAPAEASVRCDLLVRRGSRRCVAEVKTGALAPRLDHAPTRRQLLEYRLAFDVDGVLLVDAEAGRVSEVVFPLATHPRRSQWPLFAAGLALGAAGAWAALMLS